MPANDLGSAIHHLGRAALLGGGAGLTDGQLLDRFVSGRDAAAIEALVRRHAPMVWGTVRRVLRDRHDAEDAFQATFLVLARKAASILPREMVANWLYGVAHQTALKARATAARRRGRERQVERMPEPSVAEQDRWDELVPLLDQELSRLPDKYRAVLVLCDLEGKTRKEVARQLGLPEGTVASRLARARATLAKRLARRGVVLSGGALAAVLSQNVASAGAPTSVVSSTIKAASLFAAGQVAAPGAISARVAALTEGVLKTMLLTKLKIATAVLLAVVLVFGMAGLGIGLFNHSAQAGARGGGENDAPKPPPAKEADKPKTDQERLQGTWEFVSAAQGDKTIRKEDLGKEGARWKTITFTGDKVLAVNVNTGGKEVEFPGRFKLGVSRKPKTIDLTALDGESKGGTTLGLYELDGDVLKLCFFTQPPRPRGLDSKDEVLQKYLLTFKRAAK
jgi:RNA polymerase sigma factor (sigma-70 family)